MEVAQRIHELDLSLFNKIPTQSSDGDRQSWLAVQRSIRSRGYRYLEIGSYLGGSLQQHVVDKLCLGMVSIDRRPYIAPDDRGQIIAYEQNSTELMLEKLRAVSEDGASRITTFECDASEINNSSIETKFDFCFIDGEHTKKAVVSDFDFCLKHSTPDATICFHDARIVYPAIAEILGHLSSDGVSFKAGRLAGDTFAIFLRSCPCISDQFLSPYLNNSGHFMRTMRIRHLVKSFVPQSAHGFFRRLHAAP